MADNATLPATGEVIAADDIGGVLYQRVKPTFGADGSATDVSVADPLPIAAYGELIEAIEALRMTVGQLANGIGRAMPDTAQRLRVVIDAITASLTLATITTVGTVSTVTTVSTMTNQTQMGGLSAVPQIPALMGVGVDTLRRNISVT